MAGVRIRVRAGIRVRIRVRGGVDVGVRVRVRVRVVDDILPWHLWYDTCECMDRETRVYSRAML